MKASAEIGRTELQSDRRFSLREAAYILELPQARLRALARAGFLAPQRGPIGPPSFAFQDLMLLRTTKELLEAGVPMRRIRRIWSSLRRQLAADLPHLVEVRAREVGVRAVGKDQALGEAGRVEHGDDVLVLDRPRHGGASGPVPGPSRPGNPGWVVKTDASRSSVACHACCWKPTLPRR